MSTENSTIRDLNKTRNNYSVALELFLKHPQLAEEEPAVYVGYEFFAVTYYSCPSGDTLKELKETFGLEGWIRVPKEKRFDWELKTTWEELSLTITLTNMEPSEPIPVKPSQWPLELEGGTQ